MIKLWWNVLKRKLRKPPKRIAAIQKERVNVGKTTVQILFMDMSNEQKEFYGYQSELGLIPSKIAAQGFMADLPRLHYRVYSDGGETMTFKDVKSVKILRTEEYIV